MIWKNVYFHVALTPLRAQLLNMVKDQTHVESVFTREGIFHCNMANGSHILVQSPDDLFRLGLDDVDLNELGLPHVDF